MALIICDQVTKGMRSSERTIAIKDAQGRRVFLRVEEDFLTKEAGRYWLTVGVINEDKNHEAVLIELPQESESGTYRLWAKTTDLLELDHSQS